MATAATLSMNPFMDLFVAGNQLSVHTTSIHAFLLCLTEEVRRPKRFKNYKIYISKLG